MWKRKRSKQRGDELIKKKKKTHKTRKGVYMMLDKLKGLSCCKITCLTTTLENKNFITIQSHFCNLDLI